MKILKYVEKIIFDDRKKEVKIYEDGQWTSYYALYGKHSIWIPDRNIKIVWSWKGKICAWKDWDKSRGGENIFDGTWNNDCDFGWDSESLASIESEIKILNLLSAENMAPNIGGLIHFQQAVSKYPFGDYQCDCMGVFGYEMANAYSLPFGSFKSSKFRQRFIDTGIIEASPDALGDVGKPDNCVNGYLIDVRRTLWDMMILKDDKPQNSINLYSHGLDKKKLERQIKELTQFPHKQRKQNYQTYFLNNQWREGSRDTLKRFKTMNIKSSDLNGKTILDIGCNLGAICLYSHIHGARYIVGIDNEIDYIDCARDLAKINNAPINYMKMDLTDNRTIGYIRNMFPMGIDILFALSVYKHIGNALWPILTVAKWKTAYIESHNAPEGEETDHVKSMIAAMENMGCKITKLGITNDRSPRLVWKLEK